MQLITKNDTPKCIVFNLIRSSLEIESGMDFDIEAYNEMNLKGLFEITENDEEVIVNEISDKASEIKVVLGNIVDSLVVRSEFTTVYVHSADINAFEVYLSKGNLEIDKCRIASVKAQNDEGDIIIENIDDFEKMELNENSGNIDIYSKGAIRKLLINSQSGDVDVDITGGFEYAMINTQDSNIFFKARTVETIELQAKSEYGEVDNRLKNETGRNKAMLHSINGNIVVRND